MSAPENTLRVPDSKLAHLDACLTGDVGYKKTTGLESWDFENQAAANISLDHINVETVLVGKKIAAPVMIAPMTDYVCLLNRRPVTRVTPLSNWEHYPS